MQQGAFVPKLSSSFESSNLNSVIKEAMKKTRVLKETDLAFYLPHGDGHLSSQNFLRFKEIDKQSLLDLIKMNILDQEPKKFVSQETKISLSNDSVTLERLIELAMEKVTAKKESDLCFYIPYYDGRLHHFTYDQMKAKDPKTVAKLIKKHILDKKPQKISRKYRQKDSQTSKALQNKPNSLKTEDLLESIIHQAMKKRSLNLKKEEDLCRYIPFKDKFLHPLAFRSLKKKDPEKLKGMIQEFVLNARRPRVLKWKRTPAALSFQKDSHQKEPSSVNEESKFNQLLEKTSQSVEMMSQLLLALQNQKLFQTKDSEQTVQNNQDSITEPQKTFHPDSNVKIPDRYLRTIQNQLIKQIRQKQVDYELWETYVDMVAN